MHANTGGGLLPPLDPEDVLRSCQGQRLPSAGGKDTAGAAAKAKRKGGGGGSGAGGGKSSSSNNAAKRSRRAAQQQQQQRSSSATAAATAVVAAAGSVESASLGSHSTSSSQSHDGRAAVLDAEFGLLMDELLLTSGTSGAGADAVAVNAPGGAFNDDTLVRVWACMCLHHGSGSGQAAISPANGVIISPGDLAYKGVPGRLPWMLFGCAPHRCLHHAQLAALHLRCTPRHRLSWI
jgi:hypothetical protein